MNEVICEFCNSTLSSKYVLKGHLLNNKACLTIRNIDFKSVHLCRGCNSYHTCAKKLSVHHDICKDYKCLILNEENEEKMKYLKEELEYEKTTEIKEIETIYKKEKKEYIEEKEAEIVSIKSLYENYMKEKEKEIKDLENAFTKEQEHKDEKIKDLQTQLDKMFSTIEGLAKQAIDKPNMTTTNNNVNVRNVYSDTYFLEKLTHEDVKKKFRNHLTEEIFFQGQRGIAKMCTEHVIHTKDNKVLLTCSDVSRKKFKYIDELGNIKEDYDAIAFTEKVIGPIKQVSKEVYDHIVSTIKDEREQLEHKKDQESMERKTTLHYKTDMAADCFQKIIFIDMPNDNSDFKNELARLNK